VWKFDSIDKPKKISNITSEYTPTDLPRVETIHYTSNGWDIESLLVLPKDYDSTKTYPTLVYLHGGPESCVTANFTELISARTQSAAYFLAEHGYAVLLPNFRGSSGYGDAFEYELANYKIMQSPYEDVLAGVDYLINEGIADKDKLGIYGSSFGAWLTAWSISRTQRFKGAVGAVGIYDTLQRDRYGGATPTHASRKNRSEGTIPKDLWFQPDVYKEMSPMENFETINTPMLFIETGAERRLNGSCARPLFNGLLARGIKTNLVYYPKAFHNGGWNDEYKKDYMQRLVAWFDHCLKEEPLPDDFLK
jgi:dipeptidyl aminopeptidase/acylaminoacyl peptidase